MTVIAVVVIAVVAITFSFVYLNLYGHPRLQISSENTVVNKTVIGDFLNYSSSTSKASQVTSINVTTFFVYRNNTSNITLRIVGFHPYYSESYNGFPTVLGSIYAVISGNITHLLRPTSVLLTVSNKGQYDNKDMSAAMLPMYIKPLFPLSNVTVPRVGGSGVSGDFSFNMQFGLVNQSSNTWYQFGMVAVVQFFILVSNETISSHIFHVSAALQGLGTDVSVTSNILMVDVP